MHNEVCSVQCTILCKKNDQKKFLEKTLEIKIMVKKLHFS